MITRDEIAACFGLGPESVDDLETSFSMVQKYWDSFWLSIYNGRKENKMCEWSGGLAGKQLALILAERMLWKMRKRNQEDFAEINDIKRAVVNMLDPYCVAQLECEYVDGCIYEHIGVAKCNPTDEWNREIGMNLALRRALNPDAKVRML